MARIEASTVINGPIEEVFAFVSDMANAPQWSWKRRRPPRAL
jgi:uncharacterized protein YndB with AHSA1/START domain